jgi:lipopolysaccharide/colanic/teichoic acid biosynthesis glycosyltransferase
MQESNGVPARPRFGGDRRGQRGSIGTAASEPFQNLLGFGGSASYWSVGPSLKRLFDATGALLLAVLFLPLIAAIGLLMRRQNGGPILFRQKRVGQGGQLFTCLKFRTMVPNAERLLQELLDSCPDARAEWLATQKLQRDPRVTRLGRFLRRTSLDELPQLWNILWGDMSLVGPRPVIPEELARYGRNASVYLSAKPGLTGLWQVNGRNNTTYRRRVALDVYYIRYGGPLLDILILFRTAGVILGRTDAF